MAFKSLFLATLLAGTALAGPICQRDAAQHIKCGTRKPTAQQKAALKKVAAAELQGANVNFAQADISVPVYVHVIAKSESRNDGYMSVSKQNPVQRIKCVY